MKKKPPPKPTPAKRKLAREIERVMIPPTRESLLDSLRQIVPGAFADGDFNLQQFADIIGIGETGGERYRFDWAGKREAVELLQSPTASALIPRRQESAEFDSTRNIYIEGDNLEAMKLLCTAYAGRVKMIYIDPPYNTANDFIYADNFRDPLGAYLEFSGQLDSDGKAKSAKAKEEEKKINGRVHSRWLSMMYPRLFVARELLRDDGVIFISIDDNEVHHLRLLMNMVFGEENFISQLIHQRAKGGGQAKHVVKGHDYILLYAKNLTNETQLKRKKVIQKEIIERDGRQYLVDDDVVRKVFGKYDKSLGDRRCFYEELLKYKSKEKKQEVDENIRQGRYFLKPHKSGMRLICELIPLEEAKSKIYSIIKVLSEKGKEDLEALSVVGYDYPKPKELIQFLVESATDDTSDDIVLDFFSGSATTAHAVMELNAEDGGTRRCISIQIPEACDAKSEAAKAGYKTIADIGKERIRRAAQKIREQNNDADIDSGFRVFQLACSNFREWSGAAKGTLESWKVAQQAALDLLPDKFDEESVVAEIMLVEGWTLTCRMEKLKSGKNRVWRITDSDFADGEKTMHICLDDKIAPDLHRRLGLTEDSVLVVRDKALTDCLAANLALQCRLKTV